MEHNDVLQVFVVLGTLIHICRRTYIVDKPQVYYRATPERIAKLTAVLGEPREDDGGIYWSVFKPRDLTTGATGVQ